ncbi:MAG: alpha/beta fold hydrolase [Patescibacteria group bacterium]
MNKISWVVIGVGLLSLIVYFSTGNNAKVGEVVEQITSPTYDEVSIQAFSKRQFTGSDFTVGRVLETHSTYTRYFVTYKSEDLTISGIMNKPNGDGPFPVLILNHGHIDTSVYTNGRGLRREQDFFARNGYVVVHPDYRNHAQSDKDETTDGGDFRFGYTTDVINAVNALKAAELSYIDTNRVGMLGHSMGGGITEIILVSQPNLVDAAVLYAPVSGDVVDNFNKWTRPRMEISSTILEQYGEPEDNPKFWSDLSPISFVDKIRVPVMVQQGTLDDSCPIEWADKFVSALEGADKEVDYRVYEGERHEFSFMWSEFMNSSLEFFNKNV